jgi:hypothetical protein
MIAGLVLCCAGIGSGSDFAEAAARALMAVPGWDAMSIGKIPGIGVWPMGSRGPWVVVSELLDLMFGDVQNAGPSSICCIASGLC